jgi:Trypsin-co-occurring domain 1
MVEFRLEEGGSVWVETNVSDEEAGSIRAARGGELVDKAVHTFEDALRSIRPAAESVLTTIRDMGQQPKEVSVAFGIKLSAGIGAFIASATAESNFTVTLTWQASSKDAPAQP